MNIKKIITGLSLLMLLSSGAANADWGDVYYCQMTNFDKITPEGEKKSSKLEKFKFKLNRTKKTMEFGSGGFFDGISYALEEGAFFPSQEMWYAQSNASKSLFEEGKFFVAYVSNGITSISADCDKF